MTLTLHTPLDFWRAGRCVRLTQENVPDLSPYEAALLLQLSCAGYALSTHGPTIAGDAMNDDFLLPDYDRSRSLTIVTAPSNEPVTLASAKTFLRVEHTGDDEPITRAITAARQQAEQYLHLALLPQTWDYKVGTPRASSICLPFGPAQSITSVTATSLTAGSSAVSASNYRLSVDGWKVIFTSLPYTDIVTVRYVASIAATVADVPALIVQGILHHVAAMMESRNGLAAIPKQSLDCYQPYRRISL